ncbi:MAG: NUDIX domain-containing protein [Bacteroidales bacterium]
MVKLNPHISVDCVVFGFDYKYLKVLLVEKEAIDEAASKKAIGLKLPGALISENENLDDAAGRVLTELTGLKDIYLKRFDVFGDVSRMQNTADVQWLRDFTGLDIERVVTIAYYSLVKLNEANSNGGVLANAHWININEIPQLAFDHNQIVTSALMVIRKELRTDPIGFELLPERFSIRQVQNLYEVILGISIDNRNFRKRFLKLSYIRALDEKEENVSHKPALLYSFDRNEYEQQQKRMLEFLL